MKATHKIIYACLTVMFAAALASYPLAMIGLEAIAGFIFLGAMVTAWIAAIAAFLAWLWC